MIIIISTPEGIEFRDINPEIVRGSKCILYRGAVVGWEILYPEIINTHKRYIDKLAESEILRELLELE